MKEKYIGKSTKLSGAGEDKNAPVVRIKGEINIDTPEEISAEDYNSTEIFKIRDEVKRAKLLGPNVLIRLFRHTDAMREALFQKIPTESGTAMTAKKGISYQEYGTVVSVGQDCKLGLKAGQTIRIAAGLEAGNLMRHVIFFNGDFDNYYLLNENLIAWYE